MEKLILTAECKTQIVEYRNESCLTHYEPALLQEILDAVENEDVDQMSWFNQFGNSFRTIIMNVYAYRKGLEFGFTEIAFDKYDWFKRPEFLEKEEVKFGNPLHYGEHSTLSVARGVAKVWTYALSHSFGTAGGGYAISVYGKQFKNREEALSAGIDELKTLMTGKLNNTDTTNFKQAVIQSTLKDIAKYEVSRVQLTLF